MSYIQLKNGKRIGESSRPYIIAELNSSHNGKIETAKLMIDAAKECGCDCIKLQSWSADSLYSDEYYKVNPISKRIVSKFSLSGNQIKELAMYCDDMDIDFSSTPYSESEVDFLVENTSAPFIKIASMEINNIPFLKYIASKGLPMILSTGMSTIDEIKTAVKAIESTGNTQLLILHCVSVYPADASIINLNNIKLLQQEFPQYPVGYSDHTIGYEVPVAAIAMGASCIEKHFTLDNKKMGMDNNMATEPETMKKLVSACHNVFIAMGNYQRVLLSGEEEQRLKMRRSLVASCDINEGDVITYKNIEAKRPGDGIPPTEIDNVVGKKVNNTLLKGHTIRWDDLI